MKQYQQNIKSSTGSRVQAKWPVVCFSHIIDGNIGFKIVEENWG